MPLIYNESLRNLGIAGIQKPSRGPPRYEETGPSDSSVRDRYDFRFLTDRPISACDGSGSSGILS